MRWLFWCSVCFIGYTYAGYPCWLYLRSRLRRRPVRKSEFFPAISVILAARNEEQFLPRKLENLRALDYPAGRLEIIIVSDGSTDSTGEILERAANACVRPLILQCHQGKASALNRAVETARGDVLVLTDARQLIAPGAIKELAANFADLEVGCVSGELMLGEQGGPESQQGVGLYWKYEKLIRQWESASGAVVGATGALYAVRKELWVPLPAGTLLDDVYQPLHTAKQGRRVLFEPQARAWDDVVSSEREFRRKVRTLTGNYQLLQLSPWLLTSSNPLRFEFICHKIFRLLVPFALVGLFVSSLILPGPFYRAALLLQVIFYGLALVALWRPRFGIIARLADVALAFLLMNTAAAVALVYFLTGKKRVWVR
ncbi:MAG TPA: glycosyltransferase family 2 protein [Terriglobia bacterium]|nr:glycosyltransferase family 2 protein [Terriglobia bacterium]